VLASAVNYPNPDRLHIIIHRMPSFFARR
jgi:hypothetical protein